MKTEPIFCTDPYRRDAQARVLAHTPEGGIVCDASVFYPTGGGQPGDSGWISWRGGRLQIATTVKGDDESCVLVPAEAVAMPSVGSDLHQELDWERRHRHMRMHTALHLLSVVVSLPVTGGAIATGKGRLDFLMPEPPEDRDAIETALNALVEQDLPVSEEWICETELAAEPALVKTMSVMPPRGSGRIRLVRIGQGEATVDLQPCGGTHVARTGEIGHLSLGKIESKGKQNRRVSLVLDV